MFKTRCEMLTLHNSLCVTFFCQLYFIANRKSYNERYQKLYKTLWLVGCTKISYSLLSQSLLSLSVQLLYIYSNNVFMKRFEIGCAFLLIMACWGAFCNVVHVHFTTRPTTIAAVGGEAWKEEEELQNGAVKASLLRLLWCVESNSPAVATAIKGLYGFYMICFVDWLTSI